MYDYYSLEKKRRLILVACPWPRTALDQIFLTILSHHRLHPTSRPLRLIEKHPLTHPPAIPRFSLAPQLLPAPLRIPHPRLHRALLAR